MSRRNGRGRIHLDLLQTSRADDIALAQAVEDRFLDLSGTYMRVKGTELVPPPELNADMLAWRKMRVRHKAGDFRHTGSELKSTQRIAQWTLDVNAALRNQETTKMEWR